MVYKKKGLPEEGELVICTVKKVLYHSVFVSLDEYLNKEGLIHISEIAPGRIRNIRDYVREGKQIVCKVLTVNLARRTIDLSLRRVSVPLRLKKEDEYKQEQKAEKLLDMVAKKLNETLRDAYSKAGEKIIEAYGSLGYCFQEVVSKGKKVLDELGIPEQYSKELAELIKERMKPPKVSVAGELTLESFESDGIERIKAAIKKGEQFAKDKKYDIKITYISAPKYLIELTASDYKTGESNMAKTAEVVIGELKKLNGFGSFKKKE